MFVGCTQTENHQAADTVYINGTVITMNEKAMQAEAVAVKNGEIIYVGNEKAMASYIKATTKTVDLNGKTLLPAFVDPHSHAYQVGLVSSGANIFSAPDGAVNSIDDLIHTLKKWQKNNQTLIDSTGWIFAMGFDDSQLKEQRFPTKADLDKVSTNIPMLVMHQSGHLSVLNSKALELTGLNNCKKTIKGGSIRCIEGTEQANGVLEENANMIAASHFLSTINDEVADEMLLKGLYTYTRYGYTTAQEGRALKPMLDTAIRLANKKILPIDLVMYLDSSAQASIKPPFYQSGYQNPRYLNNFRIGGVKLAHDGSPQGKTAWLTEPYHVTPEGQPNDYLGYSQLSQAQANAIFERAFKEGMQIIAHANGDASIDQHIKAVSHATEKYGLKDRRTVMIHAQTLRKDQIPKLKALNILPSLYPMHTFYWGDWHYSSVLGPERAAFISPTKAVLDAGVTFTSHTDAPVTPPNAMRVLSATVTRETRSGRILGPDQRVSPLVALKALTIWSAKQHFEENTKGSIEVGKQADFVLISDNPLTLPHQQLIDIKVLKTINNDKVVYQNSN